MKLTLSFDDVLLLPQFSNINSRADVDPSTKLMGLDLKLGIISSNMDTVTEEKMAIEMYKNGAIGCLHRFMPIKNNVYMYEQVRSSNAETMVSVGIGPNELERFEALRSAGAEQFIVDVANGASMNVVNHIKNMRAIGGKDFQLMVGNFATGKSIKDFLYHLGSFPDAFKLGIGGGSCCITRNVSGCGMPTLASIFDCVKETDVPLVADGGIRNSADLAKALAAGAKAVMIGGLLAGTDESPGEPAGEPGAIDAIRNGFFTNIWKPYKGSASAQSYKVQGKEAPFRAPEGESFLVPYVGPVSGVLQTLEGGLRGSMSTIGAMTLAEFRERAEWVQITSNGVKENRAHGKTR